MWVWSVLWGGGTGAGCLCAFLGSEWWGVGAFSGAAETRGVGLVGGGV